MNLACKSAILNRGVSHLIFPDEVQTLPAEEDAVSEGPEGRMTPLTITPPQESVDKAVDLLARSKHPAIIVGHGARFSMPSIIEFAEYAKLCGALGIHVTDKAQLDDAIVEALAHNGPSMVEISADAELI